jgi:hypothetical protein
MSGARVAVHSTLPSASQLVAAGLDSIEHGIGWISYQRGTRPHS